MIDASDKYLPIGLIRREHGIKGEFILVALTDDPKRLKKLDRCFLLKNGDYIPVTAASVRLQPDGTAIVLLKEISDRDEAHNLRGQYLYIDRKDAVKLPEGRYFIVDLIKCSVVDKNEIIANVDEVLQPGANDVFYCTMNNGKRILIPFIEQAIEKIDIEKKLIYLTSKALDEVVVFED